jgi:hypothetical protein
MDEVIIQITPTPPAGVRWELVGQGKVLKRGTAGTRVEAEAAADKALEALKAKK